MIRRIATISLLLCGMLCILVLPRQADGDWDHPRFFFSAGLTSPAQQADSERGEQRPSTTVTATTQTKKHHQRIIAVATKPPRETSVQRTDPPPAHIPLAPALFRYIPRGPPPVC